MKITKDYFIRNSIENIPSEILDNLSLEAVKKNLEMRYEYLSKRCMDKKLAKEYRDYRMVANTRIEDYLFKEFEIQGVYFIATIAFIKDVDHPYIAVQYIDKPLDGILSNWSVYSKVLLEKFSAFSVSRISLFIPSKTNMDDYGIPYSRDEILYAMPLKESPQSSDFEYTIKKVGQYSDLEYQKIFEDHNKFQEKNPEILFGGMSTLVDLNKWIQKGEYNLKVFKIFMDSKWVGCFSIEERNHNFFHGVYISDKHIFKEFTGQGISAKVQNYLIMKYYSNLNKGYVFGTVAHNNYPSIKSAEKTRRKPVYEYVFLE